MNCYLESFYCQENRIYFPRYLFMFLVLDIREIFALLESEQQLELVVDAMLVLLETANSA